MALRIIEWAISVFSLPLFSKEGCGEILKFVMILFLYGTYLLTASNPFQR